MPDSYELKPVSPKDIDFSRENPRGENEEAIRSDKAFTQLLDSVAQFGVLVPIVVHRNPRGRGKTYTLVDGERRLRAALQTGRKIIPAHVASAHDRMDERVQAFHIHMLRKQWRPVAIARAFKRIKGELKNKQTWRSNKELLHELQARTGCTTKQLEDLERAIHYPAKVLKDVDDGTIGWSHLVQFEASFIEQLNQHYPKLLIKLGKREVRKVLVKKARQKVIRTTRDLIANIVPIVQRAKTVKEKKLAEKLFERFITQPDCSPEVVKLGYDKIFPPPMDQLELANEILKACELLNPMIEQIEASQIISFNKKAREVKKTLEVLKSTASRKLRQLVRVMG